MPASSGWTDKLARKMQASKEVWGTIFGSIDCHKGIAHRLPAGAGQRTAAQ